MPFLKYMNFWCLRLRHGCLTEVALYVTAYCKVRNGKRALKRQPGEVHVSYTYVSISIHDILET